MYCIYDLVDYRQGLRRRKAIVVRAEHRAGLGEEASRYDLFVQGEGHVVRINPRQLSYIASNSREYLERWGQALRDSDALERFVYVMRNMERDLTSQDGIIRFLVCRPQYPEASCHQILHDLRQACAHLAAARSLIQKTHKAVKQYWVDDEGEA